MQGKPQVFSGSGFGGVGLVGVEVLVGLGLSGRQARVYLGLLRCGGGCVKEIADLSLVHRQEVYRLLDSLLELGLVQQNVTVPVTFAATPIAEGVRLLLAQKTGQISVMRQQTKWLIKKLSQPCLLTPVVDIKPCFGSVYEADRGKKYLNAIKTCQQSIDAVTSWRRFKQLSIHFETQLQNALKNGVTIRIVTEKPASHHLPKWVNLALENYQNFEVKIIAEPPLAGVSIFDQSQAAIASNPTSSLTKGPDLWTTHPALIAQAQTYFSAVWKQT